MTSLFRSIFSVFLVSAIMIAFLPITAHADPRGEMAIKRVPPIMPPYTNQSGYCCMVFAINADGEPSNITTPYCSEDYLKQSSITAVQQWRYAKQKENGKSVKGTGYTTLMRFYLADEVGDLIVGKNGFPRKKKSENDYQYLCRADIFT